jgi:hypothetical protein
MMTIRTRILPIRKRDTAAPSLAVEAHDPACPHAAWPYLGEAVTVPDAELADFLYHLGEAERGEWEAEEVFTHYCPCLTPNLA